MRTILHSALRRQRTADTEHGQSLVEFAISLPLLLTLIFGTVEIASMAHSHLIVVGAARDAARLGSRGGTDSEMRTLVTAETGDLSGGVPTSCNAGTSAGMCITRASTPGPSSVKMQVCYSHALVVGFPGLLSNPKLLCSSTVMRVLIV
ncbi:MAG: pilus assembly protein [Dehalococcoidia bacterium]|nr:pilus assembly protein [Dehalococcoidia bacterium]